MRPPAGIVGRTAAVTTNAEVRFVRSTASNVSSDSLRTNVPSITPAACTSRSARPASATTAAKATSSALSAATHRAPMASAASWSGPSRRAAEHDVVAVGGEQRADGQADAAAPTGDDRNPRSTVHGDEPKTSEQDLRAELSSRRLRSLPVGSLGRASTKRTSRGHLK